MTVLMQQTKQMWMSCLIFFSFWPHFENEHGLHWHTWVFNVPHWCTNLILFCLTYYLCFRLLSRIEAKYGLPIFLNMGLGGNIQINISNSHYQLVARCIFNSWWQKRLLIQRQISCKSPVNLLTLEYRRLILTSWYKELNDVFYTPLITNTYVHIELKMSTYTNCGRSKSLDYFLHFNRDETNSFSNMHI